MSILVGIDTLHVISTQKTKIQKYSKKGIPKGKKMIQKIKKMIVQNHIRYCEYFEVVMAKMSSQQLN